MKSIFTKLVLWSFGTLLISLIAFAVVTRWVNARMERDAGPFPRLQAFELSQARKAYESGGSSALSELLSQLNAPEGPSFYLLNGQDRDLATGEDRSSVMRALQNRWNQPVAAGPGIVMASSSHDGKYRLLMIAPPLFNPWRYIPYYGLILFAVALLCWPLAMNIGAPLRAFAAAVNRFGQGDLSVRLKMRRKDEIGVLAESFDRMADRLETLLVAERRLLQDVSHELRSPLARLSFAAELVRTSPDADAAVARLKKEITRLSQLVGTLIEVTRSEGDPANATRTEFELSDLLHEVVDDCCGDASGAGRHIQFVGAQPVRVSADRELVRRAIENVIRNAVYYSPPSAAVDIGVSSNSGEALIRVRDYGPGVPEHQLTSIFQPFFRADDSRTGSTGGLGLGLSIASRAVRLHGGDINARNVEPGLEIDIVIPLRKGA